MVQNDFLLSKRWGLLIAISLVFLTFPGVFAYISNENPMPGEIVEFNISGCRYSEYNVFVKEPSGLYNEYPDYLNISFSGSNAIGTISIPDNAASGYYRLIVDSHGYPHECQYGVDFYVQGIEKNWSYATTYSADWYKEDFNDSSWSSGDTPFTRPGFGLQGNNLWTSGNNLYLRKTFELDNENTQGNIRVIGEGGFRCYVNGEEVIVKGGLNYPGAGQTFVYTTRGDTAGAMGVYVNGNTYYTGRVTYDGEYILDVSKYLKAGKNTIACNSWIESNRYEEFVVRCKWRYYPYGWQSCFETRFSSRPYFDAEFRPMQENDFYWGKSDDSFKSTDKKLISTINQYTWMDAGNNGKLWKYTKEFKNYPGNLYMSSGQVTDSNWFYWTADYYNSWDAANAGTSGSDLNERVILQPLKPFNGADTWIRKWLWSDSNETKTLEISDVSMPECYINNNPVTLESISGSYWRYSSDVNLSAGQNLIACKSKNAEFNYFDLRINEPNGPLAIIDVSVDSTEFGPEEPITFTVTFENESHPETDIALTLEAWGETDYQEIVSSASSSTADITFTPAEEGTYDFLFTAKDMIDGDTANYSTAFNVSPMIAQNIGFYPMAGTGGDEGNLIATLGFVIAGAALAGAAVIGGAHIIKGKSSGLPLKNLGGSISRASNAMNTLNSMYDSKVAANNNSFLSLMGTKYQEFKTYAAQKAEELANTMKLKQRYELEREREKEKLAKSRAARIAKEKVMKQKQQESQTMTWEQWYASKGIAMPENRSNPREIKSVAWAEMEKEVKIIKETSIPEEIAKESKDISNEFAISKILRGWGYKIQGASEVIINGVETVGGIIEDPEKLKNFFGNIGNGLKSAGIWVKNQAVEFLQNPFAYNQKVNKAILDTAVGLGKSYIHALVQNPIDTIAKTAITVGGIATIAAGVLGAPITGGASLALTLGGAAMIGGAGLMVLDESAEYVKAKTEAELEIKAKEDVDDLLWVGGGIMSGTQAIKLGNAIKPTGIIKASSDDLANAAHNAGKNTKKFFEIKNAPAMVDTGNSKFMKSLQKMNLIDDLDDAGVYFIENTDIMPLFNRNFVEWHEAGHIAHLNGAIQAPTWSLEKVSAEAIADDFATRIVDRAAYVKYKGGGWIKINNLKPFQENVNIPSWISKSWSRYTTPIQIGKEIIEP